MASATKVTVRFDTMAKVSLNLNDATQQAVQLNEVSTKVQVNFNSAVKTENQI
tara:strand:- start:1092 stop:1250 length:159 start_codon:yes stop_codon:yes gene_type:complete